MFGRVLDWLGIERGADADDDPLDWTDPGVEYGGDGPPRRYTCPECQTAFKGVLVPDYAVCPDCGSRIDEFAFYPATRRDTEFAACFCGYRWESDPR